MTRRLTMLRWLSLGLGLGLAPALALAHAGLDALDDSTREEVAKRPDDPDARLARGRLLQAKGEFDAALEEIEAAATHGGDPDLVGQARASVFLEAGFPRTAKIEIDRVLARRPDLYPLVFLRGRAWLAIGNGEAAARDFGEVIAKGPKPTPEQVLMRRDALLGIGKKEDALRALDDGMARVGHVVSLELPAVDLEVELGHWDAALARLDRLSATAPPNPIWIARRGEVLEQAGRTTEARAEYAKAVRLIDARPTDRRGKPLVELKQRLETVLASAAQRGEPK